MRGKHEVRGLLGKPEPQRPDAEVLRRAFEALGTRPVEKIASASGAEIRDGRIVLEVLGQSILVDLDSRTVQGNSGEPVSERLAAVAARYLLLAGRMNGDAEPRVSFAEIADARGYEGPFRGRVIAPLLARFGRRAEAFREAAASLGGEEVRNEGSGLGFRIRVFPRIRLAFLLHPGDEELAPGGQVLFPRALFSAFTVEDAVAMAELASRALRGKLWRPERAPAGSG